ncbi:hypothetical protein [Pseudomonas sp. Marseille-QA0892]
MPAKTSIKFSDEMLGALLAGHKTVTQRLIKPQPVSTEEYLRERGAWVEGITLSDHLNNAWRASFIDGACPYGKIGDRLKVGAPGIEAAIEIEDVRIEQLQMITIADREERVG